MSKNEGIPPGWSYNPATWGQRLPIVGLAMLGFGIATYMALFQLKILDTVWEPFFGNDSRKILTSSVSKILPIPDAALGAIGYLADAVTGAVGGTRRWRTMPWIVIMFGLAVGPLGFISILLVILQPVMFDAWCTLCLCSAAISVSNSCINVSKSPTNGSHSTGQVELSSMANPSPQQQLSR